MADTLFTDATTSVPGTTVVAAWLNDVDKAVYNTLSAVAGTNTITATGPLPVTPAGYTTGLRFFFNPANTNTGATTININTLGAKNITKFGATALVAGDLVAGAEAEIYYDGTQFQLINPQNVNVSSATGTLAIANGGTAATTGTQALINLGAVGRLIGVQRFTSNGTYTPTSGTTRVVIEAVGGGGAGGGAGTTGAGQYSVGAGGASGSYSIALFTSGFSGLSVTVGSGGTGVLAGTGNTGGATSVGTIITAPGGAGGGVVAATAGPVLAGGGIPGAVGVITGGTTIKLSQGTHGGANLLSTASTTTAYGPMGGASPVNGGAAGITANSDGSVAVTGAYGAGGGGASNNASLGTSRTGGAGTAGIVIVYEYS